MDKRICKIHNEPLLCSEQDNFQNVPILCRFCEQEKNNIQNIDNVKEKEQAQIQKITECNKKFDFQLMPQLSYKQSTKCLDIAFNKDATIMAASCNELIILFEFKDEKLRQFQQLTGHSTEVDCLQFMKKSNEFISTSVDKTFIVWEQFDIEWWKSKQVLKAHIASSITINQNEDLLISGSCDDDTVRFWQKQNNIWNSGQSINCGSHVLDVCLNDEGELLIVSIYDKKLLLIQQQDNIWMIKQKIQVEQFGVRLGFINKDQFVFQPLERQHLLIFNYDPQDQAFKQGQEIQYSGRVYSCCARIPIRYIPQIGLIMVKNGLQIHLIRKSQDGQFTVEQSIIFEKEDIFGSITDDGRYIATWDNKSQEIQIRKFEY